MRSLMVATALAMAGCAYKPIVDMKGVDQGKYEQDLAECRQYADQAHGAGTGAVVGAAAGAALSYGVSRAVGGRDPSAAARGGAVVGGASGAGAGARNKRDVVRRCLAGRGYSVLN